MYQGQIVEQGSVEDVLANPQHEYTRRLMADVPRLHGNAMFVPAKYAKQRKDATIA